MAKDASADRLVERITEGVGIVRERTIEIGSRVLWVDNIGSLVILRGDPNYALLILGAVLALGGLLILSDSVSNGLLGIVLGGALIALNLNQKVHNGLSIGTTDGRNTLIVSTDERFLSETLDLLRQKIETGSITLQGTFDIGDKHVHTGGGGIAYGDHGVAHGATQMLRTQPLSPPPPAEAPRPPPYAPAGEPQVRRFEPVADEPVSNAGGRRTAAFFIVAVLLIAATGGGYMWWRSEQARQVAEAQRLAWEAVPRTDVRALRDYLAGAPVEYRDDAQSALSNLETQRSQEAFDTNTIETYERFLADFPESQRARLARQRIADLRAVEVFLQSAPYLALPLDGATFNHFPRRTELTWAPMPGAASYLVEVQMFDRGRQGWVEESNNTLRAVVVDERYEFNFVGAQPGRWRVAGQDASGRQSAFSEWRTFEYRR